MIASTLPERRAPFGVRPLSLIGPADEAVRCLTKVRNLQKNADATALHILLVSLPQEESDIISRYLPEANLLFTARSEKAVEKTLDSQSIHLIISNIGAFGGRGAEFCGQLKSSALYSHIPVIMLVDENSVPSRIKSMESGADAYIERPLSGEMLKAQINNIIANRARIKDYFAHSVFAHMTTMHCSKEKEKFLDRLNEFISENITKKDLNATFLARLMNMSRPTLYRKVKSISDLTPNELINVTRLNKAAALISSADHKIAEIAKMAGFHSRRNFGKAFLKHFNVTPTAYQHLKKK